MKREFMDIETQRKLQELEDLYKKAKEIACNFIGYPFDEQDEQMINEATPMQAILALDNELKRRSKMDFIQFMKDNPTITRIKVQPPSNE